MSLLPRYRKKEFARRDGPSCYLSDGEALRARGPDMITGTLLKKKLGLGWRYHNRLSS